MPVLKPHEETWFDDDGSVYVGLSVDRMTFLEPSPGPPADMDERARLAAQAPAMARLLLALEWRPLGTCPSCGGLGKPIPDNPMFGAVAATGHRADCALVAVLRAAGVLP